MNKLQYVLGWNYRLKLKHLDSKKIRKIKNYDNSFIQGMIDCNAEIIRRVMSGCNKIYPDEK